MTRTWPPAYDEALALRPSPDASKELRAVHSRAEDAA
jgi:hypothetical protein